VGFGRPNGIGYTRTAITESVPCAQPIQWPHGAQLGGLPLPLTGVGQRLPRRGLGGPRNITAELAGAWRRSSHGIDRARRRESRSRGPPRPLAANLHLPGPATVYDLPFGETRTFDVAIAKRAPGFLQHPRRRVAAARRDAPVLRRAASGRRESDYGAFLWAPEDPRLSRWMQLYRDQRREPRRGRRRTGTWRRGSDRPASRR